MIEELLNALQRAVDAQHEHNKQRDEYEGYSWDYHGSYIIEAMEKAQQDFKDSLEKYIDERVDAAIDRRGLSPER